MLQLIHYFQSQDYHVVFGTTAQKSTNSLSLTSYDVSCYHLKLNHSSFDELLKRISPEIVVFDRFMTEEQFGWRVAETCPKAIRILDTEDLHCLRKTRERKYKNKEQFQPSDLLLEDISKREIAAIFRCDLSLIISQFEMDILQEIFQVNDSILFYLPFLLNDVLPVKNLPIFENRNHFVSIGNFLHPPNLDAVVRLKNEIWQEIRKQLPKAELHIYGAYPTQQVLEFNNPKDGFFVHGFAEDLDSILQHSKVLLAPLSFGAGLKGKFIDGMLNGCPSVTTSIGIEGFSLAEDWCGLVADENDAFIKKAIQLFTDKTTWKASQEKGFLLLKQFDAKNYIERLSRKIMHLQSDLQKHRQQNFIGALLQHHSMQSTKYLSKWIEEKNKH